MRIMYGSHSHFALYLRCPRTSSRWELRTVARRSTAERHIIQRWHGTEMSTTSTVNKICQIISTALGTCSKLPGCLLRLYALSESYIICRSRVTDYSHIQWTNVVLTPCHIEFTRNNKVFSLYRIILIVTPSRQKIQTKIINKIT